jgi:hypothetical protein
MTAKLGIRILVGFVFAVGGGVISNLVLKLDSALSFIVGLLLFVSSELFLMLIAHENLERVNAAALSIADLLSKEGGFSNFYVILLLSSLRSHTRRMLEQGIEITAQEETPRLWTESITHLETSLVVSSYVSPSHWWKKGYADPNIEIQKRKIAEGKSITRIFLWDDDAELQELKGIAATQKEGGIKVKQAQYKDILLDNKIKKCIQRIGTPDVAVIDNNWAFLHFLDNKRDTKSLIITHNPEKVEVSREFLGLLQSMARDF